MSRICNLLAVIALLMTHPISHAASTYHDVGTYDENGTFLFGEPIANVWDLSADGSTMLGTDASVASWTWSVGTGFQELPNPEGERFYFPDAISGDGSTVVGHADGTGYVWNRKNGHRKLQLPDGTTKLTLHSVSHDGSVIGGEVTIDERNSIARWNHGVVEVLDEIPGGGRLKTMSADATVAATQSGILSIWNSSSGFQDTELWAWDLSADGNVAVGRAPTEGCSWCQAARWTPTEGMTELGSLPGFSFSQAHSVSANGAVTVGWAYTEESNVGGESVAFVWDSIHGMRDLEAVLKDEFGISDADLRSGGLPGGPNEHSIYISGDSRTIAGGRRLPPDLDGTDPQEAWAVTLDRPLVVTSGVVGDINDNASLDLQDINLLGVEMRSDRNVALFDVNADGMVDLADRRFWVTDLAGTYVGDSDLDGEFGTADLVRVFEAGQYEDDVPLNSGWAEGDWNGDGDFTTNDLVFAFGDGGYERGPRASTHSVPEPSVMGMLISCGLSLLCTRKKF